MPQGASGDYVVNEYFREGELPAYGLGSILDGGFAMGGNLPMFSRDEALSATEVTTSTGEVKRIPKKAGFGPISSGGLY